MGFAGLKKEHKKRLLRSKSDQNSERPANKSTNGDLEDMAEEQIFEDEFRIMPRSSFINSVVRQFSELSLKSMVSNKSET